MLKLKKIAITGGLASGKTSVCRFFEECGAYRVSADALVHELLKPETDLGQEVLRYFGSDLLKHGKIDRELLAERVFQSPEQLRRLEELIHPTVLQKIEKLYLEACQSGKYNAFVVEIPLLFEIGQEGYYDITIAVVADESEAKKRWHQAGYKSIEYDLRMSRQFTPEQKAKKADYQIRNTGSLDQLRASVISLNHIIHTT